MLILVSGGSASGRGGNGDSSGSSGNAELFFHHLDEFGDFENGLGSDRFEDFFIGKGHFIAPYYVVFCLKKV